MLDSNDVHLMEALLAMFGDAFDDVNTYNNARPDSTYLADLRIAGWLGRGWAGGVCAR